MRVDELPVDVAILPAHRERGDVVDFRQVVQSEVQSADGAPPLLPVEQLGYPPGQFGMAAEPARPVDPIAVVGAFLAPDLHVPLDGRPAVAIQPVTFLGREVPPTGLQAPVL